MPETGAEVPPAQRTANPERGTEGESALYAELWRKVLRGMIWGMSALTAQPDSRAQVRAQVP